ncbi:Iswi [Symbiodinium sp. CCMP2592]|nr:Iswi [Symbiodinium sp. CCMP2592]
MKSQRKTDVVKLKHIPKCFTCGVKDERPLQQCACCPMSPLSVDLESELPLPLLQLSLNPKTLI